MKYIAKYKYKEKQFIFIYIIFIIHYLLSFINASDTIQIRPMVFITYGILLITFLFIYLFKEYSDTSIPILNRAHFIIIAYTIYSIILFVLALLEIKTVKDRNILIALSPSFFYPLFSILFVYWKSCIYYIRWINKYILPFICIANIFLLVIKGNCHANNITYVTYFASFFFKYQNKTTRFFIIISILTSFISCYINGQRAAILYIISILLCNLLSNIINVNHLKMLRFSIFIPITTLLINIYNNQFTTFNKDSENFLYDTRTFLYQDITNHLDKHNAIIWGTTPAIKYQTSLKNAYYVSNEKNAIEAYKNIKEGRMNSESQFANIIHWGGVIYLIFTSVLYWIIICYSINYVKNKIGIALILFIIMRFYFMYIEGLQSIFDQSITLWIAISLAINKNFISFKENIVHYLFK